MGIIEGNYALWRYKMPFHHVGLIHFRYIFPFLNWSMQVHTFFEIDNQYGLILRHLFGCAIKVSISHRRNSILFSRANIIM